MDSYINLNEIEKAIKPFLGELKLLKENYAFSLKVEDTDYTYKYILTFCENGYIWSEFLTRDLRKIVEKLIKEELIVNWNEESNEGYFVNKNTKVDSLPVMMAKLNALVQENLKLKKELAEKVKDLKSDLSDHEGNYKHERTNDWY